MFDKFSWLLSISIHLNFRNVVHLEVVLVSGGHKESVTNTTWTSMIPAAAIRLHSARRPLNLGGRRSLHLIAQKINATKS